MTIDSITVAAVMAAKPCQRWPESRVRKAIGDGIAAADVLTAPLDGADDDDRVWLLSAVAGWDAASIADALVAAGWDGARIAAAFVAAGVDDNEFVRALADAGSDDEGLVRALNGVGASIGWQPTTRGCTCGPTTRRPVRGAPRARLLR